MSAVTTSDELAPTVSEGRVRAWLFAQSGAVSAEHAGPYAQEHHPEHRHPWWQVMCLTGVDYFSTLGYQPGIAALAAGALSPIATVVLVLLTLFGALPVYRRVAEESPHGQGSIAMLERLLSLLEGQALRPGPARFRRDRLHHHHHALGRGRERAHGREPAHPVLPARPGDRDHTRPGGPARRGVPARASPRPSGSAVALVAVYLSLNVVVIGVSFWKVFESPHVISDWTSALTKEHGNPVMMLAMAVLVFPKLALGMSGFETGVAVMAHVDGGPGTPRRTPSAGSGRPRSCSPPRPSS